MSSENLFVISVGGSLIFPNDAINIRFLSEFTATIKEFVNEGYSFGLVTGGGQLTRHYQNVVKELNPSVTSETMDEVGIVPTKLNATAIIAILGEIAYPEVIPNPTDIPKNAKQFKVMVTAGWKPGASTDYDAVLLAFSLGVKTVINLSNIDYVYDSDPRKNKDAKPRKTMSWTEFENLYQGEWKPGLNLPFDPIAAKFAKENSMKVIVCNGNDSKNLKDIIKGREFKGTVIQ